MDTYHTTPVLKDSLTALKQIVQIPWQNSQKDAEEPWYAPESLVNDWLNILNKNDSSIETDAALVGLCRSAHRSADIIGAIETATSLGLPHNPILLSYILTGCTPPQTLWDSYFKPHLTNNPSPTFLHHLGLWLRHPSQAALAQKILGMETTSSAWIRFSCLLNPFVDLSSVLPVSLWEKSFLRAKQVEKLGLPDNEDILSWIFLCVDRKYHHYINILNIPPMMYELCDILDIKETVDIFTPSSRTDIIANSKAGWWYSVQRIKTPTLNFPWNRETPDAPIMDAVYMAYACTGVLPYNADRMTVWEGSFSAMIRTHPIFL